MLRSLSTGLLWLALAAATVAPGAAQSLLGTDPGSSLRTRADLERLLAEYELALASPAYSESVKQGIRSDATLIRSRLEDGDFRVGDRIMLDVQGEAELPDTVTVEPGPAIVLPVFGRISLAGVLRSEIEPHLTQELRRFIREPVVRASGQIRISVQGQVASPGFYAVPASLLLGDALMVAGGPMTSSNIAAIRIERGPVTLLEGEALQEAIRIGWTLDQLNLQAGDQIVVPQRSSGGFLGTLGLITGIVGSLGFLVFQLMN